MKAIGKLRNYARENKLLTPEILEDLGFKEVLAGSWKLQEPLNDRKDSHSNPYMSTVYVRFDEDGVALIEADNLYGSVKIGNPYIYQSATVNDLLNVVELLKI